MAAMRARMVHCIAELRKCEAMMGEPDERGWRGGRAGRDMLEDVLAPVCDTSRRELLRQHYHGLVRPHSCVLHLAPILVGQPTRSMIVRGPV